MYSRQLLKVVSILFVAVFLASCAAPAAQAPTAANNTAPETSKLDLQGYQGPALTDKPITLRFLRQVYGDPQEAYYKDILAKWSAAYPNITIQMETVPFGELFTKVMTSAAGGNPPDIMMGQGDFTRNYVFSNVALPLNDYLKSDYLNDYVGPLLNMVTVDGKTYLFPYELQASTMAYNKDQFAKAGITTEPPQNSDTSNTWTWDQWLTAFQKIQDSQGGPDSQTIFPLAPSYFGAGGPGSNYWHEGILIRSFGDPNAPKDSTAYKTWLGISPDGLTATGYVDTPEAIVAMTLYQSLFTKKYTPTAAMSNAWTSGMETVNWGASQDWADVGRVPFKASIAANPIGKVQFTHISGDAPFISTKTKYPAEAAAFLAFLCNDANRIEWYKIWGSVPARKSIIPQVPEWNQWPYTMFFDEVSKFGAPAPQTPGTLEYETAMNEAIKDIALGADPATRLHQAAQKIDSVLAKYKQ
jgi:ABC-type glycerol-3-phosphate transport system substrate-binding protein